MAGSSKDQIKEKLDALAQNMKDISHLIDDAAKETSQELSKHFKTKKEEMLENLNKIKSDIDNSNMTSNVKEQLQKNADEIMKSIKDQSNTVAEKTVEQVNNFCASALEAMGQASQITSATLQKYAESASEKAKDLKKKN